MRTGVAWTTLMVVVTAAYAGYAGHHGHENTKPSAPRSSGVISKSSHQFTVDANYDQLAAWYEVHRAEILKASNCRILKDEGNGEYLVQTKTSAGDCQYVIRESKLRRRTHDGRGQWVYIFKYVRNVRGWVADQELSITLTDLAGETEVDMAIWTRVSGIRVPVFVLRTMQRRGLKGCENYVVKHS